MVQTQLATFDNISNGEFQRLHELLVHAYAETEVEVWGENYSRLSLEEFKEHIEKGNIYVARLNGEVVGSIGVFQENETTFNFGLLNADFTKKGNGIGLALVQAAEQHARDHGGKSMHIEILRPSNIEAPFKDRLDQWYRKLGYDFVESMSFEERKPNKAEKAKSLVNPSQFDCYVKALN
jgi:GNAT superfamily N-acetyltransferase